MSALGRLLEYGQRRGESVSQEEFAAALAGGSAKGSITDARALGLAAWYSGVRYLAESLAYLPVRAFRGSGDNRSPRDLPLWLRTPEKDPTGRPLMTRGRLLESWMVSLLHRGNGYGWKLRDNVGRVDRMRYLHPDRVKKIRMEGTTKIFTVDMDGRGGIREVTSREIFHIVGLSSNGVEGISPIEAHGQNLGIAVSADEFAGKYFDQGAMLSAYIQLTKSTRKELPELKAEFEEFYEGINNAHKGAVLSAGAEYVTVPLNAKDTQILEARGWSVLEIARILRVPPHKLYDLTRATFSNIEQQAIEAVGDGPRVWAERFEEQVSADPDLLPSSDEIEFNLDALTRGDTAAEVSAIHSGIQDGYVSLADARRARGLPEAPGMDVVYRPANVHVVDIATGDVIIPAGAPTEDASDSDDDDAPLDEPAGSETDPRSAGNGHGDVVSLRDLSEIIDPEEALK